MSISKRTLETLIDLVEIKLSCIEVYDREDARELANLERCHGELKTIMTGAKQAEHTRPHDEFIVGARWSHLGRIRAT